MAQLLREYGMDRLQDELEVSLTCKHYPSNGSYHWGVEGESTSYGPGPNKFERAALVVLEAALTPMLQLRPRSSPRARAAPARTLSQRRRRAAAAAAFTALATRPRPTATMCASAPPQLRRSRATRAHGVARLPKLQLTTVALRVRTPLPSALAPRYPADGSVKRAAQGDEEDAVRAKQAEELTSLRKEMEPLRKKPQGLAGKDLSEELREMREMREELSELREELKLLSEAARAEAEAAAQRERDQAAAAALALAQDAARLRAALAEAEEAREQQLEPLARTRAEEAETVAAEGEAAEAEAAEVATASAEAETEAVEALRALEAVEAGLVEPPLQSSHEYEELVICDVKYEKLDLIGRGGTSQVFRVLSKGQIYALKQVSYASDPSLLEAVKNEVELMHKLTSLGPPVSDFIIRLCLGSGLGLGLGLGLRLTLPLTR